MTDAVQEKKDALMQAACKLFEYYGYAKTSVSDIASEAGLGKGTFYYYFNSKEDVLLEIVREQSRYINQQVMRDLEKATSTRERIYMIMVHPFKYIDEKGKLYLRLLAEEPNFFMTKVREFKKESFEMTRQTLLDVFETGKKRGEIRDDVETEKVIDVIQRWFFLADENMHFTITKEMYITFKEDMTMISKLILDGILVKGV